jgi:hypothetical protein
MKTASEVKHTAPHYRQQLVHEAREMILRRAEKYSNPENLDYDFEDADKWERHAINAVSDLQRAEAINTELLEALKNAALYLADMGKGEWPRCAAIQAKAEAAIKKAQGE